MSPLNLRMPLRFMRGAYGRVALSVVALACGVALVCAIDLVNRAVLRAFVAVVDTMAGRATLQVMAGEGSAVPEGVAATVAALPGVELAVPVVRATAFTTDGSGEMLTIHGVDVTDDAAVREYAARDEQGVELDEPLVFLSQPDSIILTRVFASRRHLDIGSRIELETPRGRKRFTVRGLLEPRGVARVFGGRLAVMDLYAAEEAFTGRGLVNRVDVVVRPGVAEREVARAIARRLPPGLEVRATAQERVEIRKLVGSLQAMLRGVALLGLISAFLIAFNRLSTVFELRSWQLGILRAVGVRARVVWRELMKESFVLGAAGVAFGIPLGVLLARLLLPVITTTTSLNYKVVAPEAELELSPWSMALAGGMGIVAALAAACVPASRAARLAAAETVRARGGEQPEVGSKLMWAVRGVVLAGAGVAAVTEAVARSAPWGLVATALLMIGVGLTTRPLLTLVGAPLRATAMLITGPSGRHAAAAIEGSSRRSALTVAVLGVGFGAVVWLAVILRSFEGTVVDTWSRTVRSDLVVSSAHIASSYIEAPLEGRVARKIGAIPGVADVVAWRVVDWRYGAGPIAINAIDPEYFASGKFGRWPLFGPRLAGVWDEVAGGRAVIVTSNFVLNLGVRVGDPIVLQTPRGPLALQVAGITNEIHSPRGTIEMSRELYERYWGDSKITRVLVQTAAPGDVAPVRRAIAHRLGRRYGLRILSARGLVEYWASQVRRAFATVRVLGGMFLLVVMVGMADTLAAGVVERTRELGIVRAVGVRRRHLRRMVLAEGTIIGVVGLSLGLAVGLVLGVFWVEMTLPLLLGWIASVHLPYAPIAAGCALTVVVCLSAALLPAIGAGRLEPAAALRYE